MACRGTSEVNPKQEVACLSLTSSSAFHTRSVGLPTAELCFRPRNESLRCWQQKTKTAYAIVLKMRWPCLNIKSELCFSHYLWWQPLSLTSRAPDRPEEPNMTSLLPSLLFCLTQGHPHLLILRVLPSSFPFIPTLSLYALSTYHPSFFEEHYTSWEVYPMQTNILVRKEIHSG